MYTGEKIILNSLIWGFNHDLISIMVSRGRIHGELGYFLRCIQNLIKLNNKLRREIREISIFGNKTPRKIYLIQKSLNLH